VRAIFKKSDLSSNPLLFIFQSIAFLLNSAQADDGSSLLVKKHTIQQAATEVSNALEDVLSFVRTTDGNYKLVELASNVTRATSELANSVKAITQTSQAGYKFSGLYK
jgi:hypothetical protein